MGPRLSPGATKWSQCTKRYMLSLLDCTLYFSTQVHFSRSMSRFLDLYGGCLRNSPQRRKNVNRERKELPGQRQSCDLTYILLLVLTFKCFRFSGNDQCHLMYGVGWTHYLGQVRFENESLNSKKTCKTNNK